MHDTSREKITFLLLFALRRDVARIPLIEGLQNTYNFDIFGVCESMLNPSISNEDIFINGFSPDPY